MYQYILSDDNDDDGNNSNNNSNNNNNCRISCGNVDNDKSCRDSGLKKNRDGNTNTSRTGAGTNDGISDIIDTSDDDKWRIALRVWYDAEGPNAAKAISSRSHEMREMLVKHQNQMITNRVKGSSSSSSSSSSSGDDEKKSTHNGENDKYNNKNRKLNSCNDTDNHVISMSPPMIAPSLAIPLPNNSCYFLLDDFNHHHQHAVLAGDLLLNLFI